MSFIKVENLKKIYGTDENLVIALNNINLEIQKGEIIAISGPSGSGKSTLLHLIGGLDKPSMGEVVINDEDIYKYNIDKLAIFRRRKIGFIFQFYNLIPMLDVEENIVMPAILDDKKVDKEYLNDLLKSLDIERIKNKYPMQLSGGQQQKVTIGRALYNKPLIILADEPTGNLDSKNSQEIAQLLKLTAKKYNQTLILVTHDTKIAKIANRIITIMDGTIKEDIVNNSDDSFLHV